MFQYFWLKPDLAPWLWNRSLRTEVVTEMFLVSWPQSTCNTVRVCTVAPHLRRDTFPALWPWLPTSNRAFPHHPDCSQVFNFRMGLELLMGQFSSGQRTTNIKKKPILFSFCTTDRGETIEEYFFLIVFPRKIRQQSVFMCLRYSVIVKEFKPYRG